MKEKLTNYKAKSDGTSILKHNEDLYNVLDQICNIYNIDNEMVNSINKCIEYHDIGKCIDEFQDNLGVKYTPKIRHEILSASLKGLSDIEKLSIISHHKELSYLVQYVESEFYESELQEMKEKLQIEVEDVRPFILKVNKIKNKLTKELDSILHKGYLQYCDHVGSAGVKNIDIGFNAKNTYKFSKYNSIQEKVLSMTNEDDILLIAPTGLGKTATSLFWSDLVQNENKSKRIYYLLPYTASINSLFKDMNDLDISVGMLHSKAEYFLEKMELENTKELYNLFKKSVSQINICTIYQIIKAIFSCKRFEMLLAQLKNSIFIVDEIHCFDIEQVSLLLTTLKWLKDNLGIKICIMSASIPTIVQDVIMEELNIKQVVKAEEYDFKIRHRLHRTNKTIKLKINKIKDDLENGKKVLICVNTVDLAQELYRDLIEYSPRLIHGRYNTRDREKVEQGLRNLNLLIGTQAIEVSLDISYDVMYTEIAPLDALLQRFGRINRRGENIGLGDIYIFDNDCKVYDQKIISKTDEVIKNIIKHDNGIVLESKTQKYLDTVYDELDNESIKKIKLKINKIIKNMRVGTFNLNATDDMCNNNSKQVLPVELFDEYINYINNKEHLKAQSLFVNVTNGRYYGNKNRFEYNNEYRVTITDFKYDVLGLRYDELACRSVIM